MRHYVTLMFDVEDLCWPGSDDIPTDNPQLSPAEALDLMAQTLLQDRPKQLVPREVYGPTEESPSAAPASLEPDQLLAACSTLTQFVAANHRLPANAGTADRPIGIGTFGRAVSAWLLARDAGDTPSQVKLTAGRQVPSVADAIAERVSAGIAHWPIHDPDIDTERLLLHTRLQCWTLRPALPVSRDMFPSQ